MFWRDYCQNAVRITYPLRQLRKLGYLETGTKAVVLTDYDPASDADPELARTMAASVQQRLACGERVGQKVGAAIGVMQIMPATGKQLGVGDIRDVEANIRAGIKYMRWMIDQYYGKEPMTRLDKALFAFASYNADAGRLSQLRKEAAKRGLDPHVWFHNVEYVAAEKIGAETVTYVSNIYKYYIAYNLILEARAEKAKAAEEMQRPSN